MALTEMGGGDKLAPNILTEVITLPCSHGTNLAACEKDGWFAFHMERIAPFKEGFFVRLLRACVV
jgi:hypothetical protein